MSAATTTFLGLGLITYLLKAAGPLVLGNRTLPPAISRLAEFAPAPMLAALVVVSTVVSNHGYVFDARLGGILAAAVALRYRANFLVTVLVAAAVTAGLRALGWAYPIYVPSVG